MDVLPFILLSLETCSSDWPGPSLTTDVCGDVRAKRAGREVLRRGGEVARSNEGYLTNSFLIYVVRVVTFIRKRSMGPGTNRIN